MLSEDVESRHEGKLNETELCEVLSLILAGDVAVFACGECPVDSEGDVFTEEGNVSIAKQELVSPNVLAAKGTVQWNAVRGRGDAGSWRGVWGILRISQAAFETAGQRPDVGRFVCVGLKHFSHKHGVAEPVRDVPRRVGDFVIERSVVGDFHLITDSLTGAETTTHKGITPSRGIQTVGNNERRADIRGADVHLGTAFNGRLVGCRPRRTGPPGEIVQVKLLIQRGGLQLRQQHHKSTDPDPCVIRVAVARAGSDAITSQSACSIRAVRGFVVGQSQTDLLEVVLALAPASSLAGLLHRGQQQRDQNGDDRDHHEQFNKCKTTLAGLSRSLTASVC